MTNGLKPVVAQAAQQRAARLGRAAHQHAAACDAGLCEYTQAYDDTCGRYSSKGRSAEQCAAADRKYAIVKSAYDNHCGAVTNLQLTTLGVSSLAADKVTQDIKAALAAIKSPRTLADAAACGSTMAGSSSSALKRAAQTAAQAAVPSKRRRRPRRKSAVAARRKIKQLYS